MHLKDHTTSSRSLVDKCLKDKNGNTVLFQIPNIPLIIWIFCTLLSPFISGSLAEVVGYIGFGSLFTWCWLEITDGTTILRRLLGLVILILSLVNKI